MKHEVTSPEAMIELGKKLGSLLRGGETLELVGDVGAGKTTFTKGIAAGLAIDDDVQSPTFTISRVYAGRDGLRLVHYDFYRLVDAGILNAELEEAVNSSDVVTVVEWGKIVAGVLPADTLRVAFLSPTESTRIVTLTGGGPHSQQLVEDLA